jgi:hypothetical protein
LAVLLANIDTVDVPHAGVVLGVGSDMGLVVAQHDASPIEKTHLIADSWANPSQHTDAYLQSHDHTNS